MAGGSSGPTPTRPVGGTDEGQEALQTKTRRRTATFAGLVGVTLIVALAGSPGALAAPTAPSAPAGDPAYADVAAYKKKNDRLVRTPLSAADRRAIAAKQAAALRYAAQRDAGVSVAATARQLTLQRQLQSKDYYCGPATTSMALRAMGVWTGQPDMAWAMNTDGLRETPWSGYRSARIPAQFRTGYPVRDVLNWHKNSQHYRPISLSYNPTAQEKQVYRAALRTSIDQGWVVMGDAWEVPGGPHLLGHPEWMEIFHWYAIYGYNGNGVGTVYADPAAWGPNNGIGTMASDTITVINGGRGYIF